MKQIESLKFKKFCMTIGNLPSSYVESLSYYECLIWLCNYLENTVIPAVNTNAEAVTELQSYVEHYFDNLDVQEEINNKLDEMATDGTLENIINQEIFGDINDTLDLLTSEVTLFIGDSYATGSSAGQHFATDGWPVRVKNLMGLSNDDYIMFGEGGAGFNQSGNDGHTFLTLLQANISTISDAKKLLVKKVIVCGGYNDNGKSKNNIKASINSFVKYCKAQFPNAKIYIGAIGNNSGLTSGAKTIRQNIRSNVIGAYKECNQYGAYYLTGVENILHDYTLMSTDTIHPTPDGYAILSQGIFNAIETGATVPKSAPVSHNISGDNLAENTSLVLYTNLNGDTTTMNFAGNLVFTEAITISGTQTQFTVGNFEAIKNYRGVTSQPICTCSAILKNSSNEYIVKPCSLYISYANDFILSVHTNNETLENITALTILPIRVLVDNYYC